MSRSPSQIIGDAFITCLELETILDLTETDKINIKGYLTSIPAKKLWGLLHEIPSNIPLSTTLDSDPIALQSMFSYSPNTDFYIVIIDTIREQLGMRSWFENDPSFVRISHIELMNEKYEERFTVREIHRLHCFVDMIINEPDDLSQDTESIRSDNTYHEQDQNSPMSDDISTLRTRTSLEY